MASLLMDAGADSEPPIENPGGIQDTARLLAERKDTGTAMLGLILNHKNERFRFWLEIARYEEQRRTEFVEEDGIVFRRPVKPKIQPRYPLTIATKADNISAARLLLAAGAWLDYMHGGIALAESEEMRGLLESHR